MKDCEYIKVEQNRLTPKVLKRASSINYDDDNFEILHVYKKDIKEKDRVRSKLFVKLIVAPATEENWQFFKKFYFLNI